MTEAGLFRLLGVVYYHFFAGFAMVGHTGGNSEISGTKEKLALGFIGPQPKAMLFGGKKDSTAALHKTLCHLASAIRTFHIVSPFKNRLSNEIIAFSLP